MTCCIPYATTVYETEKTGNARQGEVLFGPFAIPRKKLCMYICIYQRQKCIASYASIADHCSSSLLFQPFCVGGTLSFGHAFCKSCVLTFPE